MTTINCAAGRQHGMDVISMRAILAKHRLWLESAEGGEPANLKEADLIL